MMNAGASVRNSMYEAFVQIVRCIDGYTNESNGNKYSTLFPTDESKNRLKI